MNCFGPRLLESVGMTERAPLQRPQPREVGDREVLGHGSVTSDLEDLPPPSNGPRWLVDALGTRPAEPHRRACRQIAIAEVDDEIRRHRREGAHLEALRFDLHDAAPEVEAD